MILRETIKTSSQLGEEMFSIRPNLILTLIASKAIHNPTLKSGSAERYTLNKIMKTLKIPKKAFHLLNLKITMIEATLQ